jgi:tRNA dimethylallyltransferase
MAQAGLVDEVRELLPAGLREGRTASRALGYAQVLAYLDGGLSEAEAFAEVTRATRRFARRQRSWFRRDPRVEWLAPGPDLATRATALASRTLNR